MGTKKPDILIVGDTPITHFLTWKFLSHSSHFNLDIVSFYTEDESTWNIPNGEPQVFKSKAKIHFTFNHFIQLNSPSSRKVDLVIFAVPTFSLVSSMLKELVPKVHPNTLILFDASFGIYLEELVYDTFPNLMVLSIIFDTDVKLIDKSHYQILNEIDQPLPVLVGFSCFPLNGYSSNDHIVLDQIDQTNQYLSKSDTILDKVFEKLDGINVKKFQNTSLLCTDDIYLTESEEENEGEVEGEDEGKKTMKPRHNQSFCSYIWLTCIKKLSFELISILFEEFEYPKLFANTKIRPIITNVVRELIDLAIVAGAPDIMNLIPEGDNRAESILHSYSEQQLANMKSSFSKYPIFLTHSNMLYCFVHKLHFPFQIMLFQPLYISENLKIPNSTLGFLYALQMKIIDTKNPTLFKRVTLTSQPVLRNKVQRVVKASSQPDSQNDLPTSEYSDDEFVDPLYFYEVDKIPVFEDLLNDEESQYEDALSRQMSMHTIKTEDGILSITEEAEQFKPKMRTHTGKSKYPVNKRSKPKLNLDPKRPKYFVVPSTEWSDEAGLIFKIIESTDNHILFKFTREKLSKPRRIRRADSLNFKDFQNQHVRALESAGSGGILGLTTGRYGHVDSTSNNREGKIEIRKTSAPASRPTSSQIPDLKEE